MQEKRFASETGHDSEDGHRTSMKITRRITREGVTRREFTDYNAQSCSIQDSSLASVEAIWFGINAVQPMVLASRAASVGIQTDETTGCVSYPIPGEVSLSSRMHLTRSMVQKLLPRWLR